MNKPFIIAEAGINHNGSIQYALELIDKAKWAGFDAIKFQKRTIDKVYTKEELDKPRESPWGATNRDQKQGLEFGKIHYDAIDEHCKEVGIVWFASAWDTESQEFLKQYDLPYNKICSARLQHEELLTMVAKEGKYTFISTGMASLSEIEQAVLIFRKHSCPFELMHCNSQYPMEAKDSNLLCIPFLKEIFNCDVGYSGHEVGLITSVAAVALGATSIERHITLARNMYGSDQSSSIEPNGMLKLVEYCREAYISLGNKAKIISEAEKICRSKLWRVNDVKNNSGSTS